MTEERIERIERKEREKRNEIATRIKTQAMMCNYGLPENAEAIGLGGLSPTEARKRIKAIHELWVRLDLWVTTGESSKGVINYPEAKRVIHYNLVCNRPENSDVMFKSLVPARKRPSRRRH